MSKNQTTTLRKLIKNNDTLRTIKYSQNLAELTISQEKDLKNTGIENNLKLSKKDIKQQKKYIKSWFNRWSLIKDIIKYN
jgi:hypothetical protein